MAIDDLGFSLLERKGEQNRRARKEARRAEKYALIGGVAQLGLGFANKALEKKAESWMQNEDVLANKLAYKRSYDDASQTLTDWDTASKSVGGVRGYLLNQVTPQIKAEYDLNVEEGMLADPDAYNREIKRRAEEIVGTADGDGLYGKFNAARQAALKLTPDSDYNTFIKNKNPAYRNVRDVILGSFSKDKPNKEAFVDSVLNSKFSKNSEAYTAASTAYQQGLSAAGAVKLGDAVKDQFKLKKDEQVLSKEQIFKNDANGIPIPVEKTKFRNRRTGTETITITAVEGNEASKAFVAGERAKIETVDRVNQHTGQVVKVAIAVGANNAVVETMSTGKIAPDYFPATVPEVSDANADKGRAAFDAAIDQSADRKEKRETAADFFTLGGDDINQEYADNFYRTTYLLGQNINSKVFGGADVQAPLRATAAFEVSDLTLANDIAAEIQLMTIDFTTSDEGAGKGLGQNLVSEVVGQNRNILGPLVLLGLDKVEQRAGGTYAISMDQQQRTNMVRSLVSVPEMAEYMDRIKRDPETLKYVQEAIQESLAAGQTVIQDSSGAMVSRNSSVFAMPFREGGAPIASLFGVTIEKDEAARLAETETNLQSGILLDTSNLPEQRAAQRAEAEAAEDPSIKLLKRKEELEARTTDAPAGTRRSEKEELSRVNAELAELGQDTKPIYMNRQTRLKLEESIEQKFNLEDQIANEPPGSSKTKTGQRRRARLGEFEETLSSIDTSAKNVADAIKELRGWEDMDVKQSLAKVYDENFTNQVLAALYL